MDTRHGIFLQKVEGGEGKSVWSGLEKAEEEEEVMMIMVVVVVVVVVAVVDWGRWLASKLYEQ